jgi:signal peptidase II
MGRVMITRKRVILVLFVIISCVGIDQLTKEMAQSYLPRTKVLSIAGDALRLDYTENRGAVLSFEYCLPERWRGSALTLAVAAFLGLLVPFLMFSAVLGLPSVIALSLIGGGTLSNLLDRAVLSGYVVDFLSLGWGGFRTAIFNVADAAITIGSLFLLMSVVWKLRPSACHQPIRRPC